MNIEEKSELLGTLGRIADALEVLAADVQERRKLQGFDPILTIEQQKRQHAYHKEQFAKAIERYGPDDHPTMLMREVLDDFERKYPHLKEND